MFLKIVIIFYHYYLLKNDYLFKKCGINSIIMDNPLTKEYNSVIPSELNQKNIIMIG